MLAAAATSHAVGLLNGLLSGSVNATVGVRRRAGVRVREAVGATVAVGVCEAVPAVVVVVGALLDADNLSE